MGSNPTPPNVVRCVSLGGIGRRGRLKIYFLRSTSSTLVVRRLGFYFCSCGGFFDGERVKSTWLVEIFRYPG